MRPPSRMSGAGPRPSWSVRTIAFCCAAWAVCGGTAAEAVDLLKNGLEGWIVEGSADFEEKGERRPTWSYADGVLHCGGRGFGFLRREGVVSDFRLELEYRFPKKGNSGIGIRTIPFTGNVATRPSKAAFEIQLLSDAGAKPDRGSCCALYGHEPPRENTSRPIGEWNSVAVECRGPRIVVVHNAATVIDFDQSSRVDTASKPLSGSICLQNHGSVVDFRNVQLVALPPVPAATGGAGER